MKDGGVPALDMTVEVPQLSCQALEHLHPADAVAPGKAT